MKMIQVNISEITDSTAYVIISVEEELFGKIVYIN